MTPGWRVDGCLQNDLTLSGKFVALEPMRAEHAQDLAVAAADGKLWTLPFTTIATPELMPSMIDRALVGRDNGEEFPFVVRRLSDNKVVGSTRYYQIEPQHRNLAIGYTWYSKSAQRTAVNTECKLLLLRYAFEQLGCISVAWHTDNENLKSQAAIKRLGAKLDGILRSHKIMPNGRLRDTYCYSMLDSEWPTSKAYLVSRLAAHRT